ncbi:MAG: helix-turn-helix domain-containing protein, partial [Planctomycetota bacterium]
MAEYYSMQEVASKLRKTEEEVQELVKQGQLRQYMDSGKAVFEVQDVDALVEEIVGLDVSSVGLSPDGSEMEIQLEETAEIKLEPDDDTEDTSGPAGPDDMELDIEPDMPGQKESEGGFGLS